MESFLKSFHSQHSGQVLKSSLALQAKIGEFSERRALRGEFTLKVYWATTNLISIGLINFVMPSVCWG